MKTHIKLAATAQEYYFKEGCFITELNNSEHDPEASIAQARLEPGKTTRWHALRYTTERYLILSGVGLVEVGDLAATEVTAGGCVIIAAGDRQRIKNIGEQDLVFLAICSPRFKAQNYVDLDDSAV